MNGFWLVPVGILLLIVPFALAQLWSWVIMWVCIGVVVIIAEAVSFFTSGKTLSGKFQDWAKGNFIKSLFLVLGIIGFAVALSLHLLNWL